MKDLTQFALLTRKDDDVVMVMHLPCKDLTGAVNLAEALEWASAHECS